MKMKSIMKLTKCKMEKSQMNKIVGGLTTQELVDFAWNMTPEGGSSTWTNDGDGCFSGDVVSSKGTHYMTFTVC